MTEINIYNLLKECPTGYMLSSDVHGPVEFKELKDNNIIVTAFGQDVIFSSTGHLIFESAGDTHVGPCCVLWPANTRDWTKFIAPLVPKFKVGDKVRSIDQPHDYVGKEISLIDMIHQCYVFKGVSGKVEFKYQDKFELVKIPELRTDSAVAAVTSIYAINANMNLDEQNRLAILELAKYLDKTSNVDSTSSQVSEGFDSSKPSAVCINIPSKNSKFRVGVSYNYQVINDNVIRVILGTAEPPSDMLKTMFSKYFKIN